MTEDILSCLRQHGVRHKPGNLLRCKDTDTGFDGAYLNPGRNPRCITLNCNPNDARFQPNREYLQLAESRPDLWCIRNPGKWGKPEYRHYKYGLYPALGKECEALKHFADYMCQRSAAPSGQ